MRRMEQFDFTDSPLHQDDRGAIRVIGSRITLDTLVNRFKLGDTPEDLHDGFPSLSFAQVKGVITWYLNHTAEADEYLAKGKAEAEALRQEIESEPSYIEFREKLRERIKQRREQLDKKLAPHILQETMLRLLIDENINHRILRGLKLRLPQIDYVLVKQIGMSGFADIELLRWAVRENRIIVTHDIKTMIPDAKRLLRIGESMAGVIFVPDQMAIGRVISDLEMMVECHSETELKDRIEYLPL